MKIIQSTSGFTLIEIIIVITMIGILLSMGTIPYNYYMDRSRVERTIDQIAQEWVLAHNSVKNGVLTNDKSHNAHLYIELEKWANSIVIQSSTGWDSLRHSYKTIPLDFNIEIQSFSGVIFWSAIGVTYQISLPYGMGMFFTGAIGANPSFWSTGVTMIIWYPGATEESGRARKILLRPYFDN